MILKQYSFHYIQIKSIYMWSIDVKEAIDSYYLSNYSDIYYSSSFMHRINI